MTEAASGGGRAEIERRLVEKSLAEEAFRQRLLEEPKAVVEEELEAVAGGDDAGGGSSQTWSYC